MACTTVVRGACVAAFLALITGCGSSSPAPSATPQQVQGIATPASVSVVTATNSN
ncbi:MAG TPA: hypothetical protein VJQ47_13510 [Steroidobacteraceae bacterium]|nr:hypothetical protein [Steroidobacteraceae bacterium]